MCPTITAQTAHHRQHFAIMAERQLHGEARRVYDSIETRVLGAGIPNPTPTKLIPFLVNLDVELFAAFTDTEPFASGPVGAGITSIVQLVASVCDDRPDKHSSLPAAQIKVTVLGISLEAICKRIRVSMVPCSMYR